MQTTETIQISDGCRIIQWRLTPDMQKHAISAAEEAREQCRDANYVTFGHKPPRKMVLLSACGTVSYAFSGGETPRAKWGPKTGSFAAMIRDAVREMDPDFEMNAILVNSYEGDNSSISMHSDDEKNVIQSDYGVIGVSVYPKFRRDGTINTGEERRMQFKNKETKRNHVLPLRHGHMFCMHGKTFQRDNLHGIAKEKRKNKHPRDRVSFTFRHHK